MNKKKYKRGLTCGVYDMFHVGHLNVFEKAKHLCDCLIVAVSTDDVVMQNKHKMPMIQFSDRIRIVESIKYVDFAIPQTRYDVEGKIEMVKKYKIDVVFVGSDWKGTDKWNEIESKLNKINCDVVYLPHTDGISSTMIRNKITNGC